MAVNVVARGTPMRSATFANNHELWHFFFHWFSNPEARRGPGLNYAGRARRSLAHVLPSGWILYDCRPQRTPALVPASGS